MQQEIVEYSQRQLSLAHDIIEVYYWTAWESDESGQHYFNVKVFGTLI